MKFKTLDSTTEEERRVNLPFNLNDVIYPCLNFTKKSIFGAAHTGEIKKIQKKGEKERGFLISDLI